MKVCNKNVPALINTGVSVSFIGPRLVASLNKEWYPMVFNYIKDGSSLEDNNTHIVIHKVMYILKSRNTSCNCPTSLHQVHGVLLHGLPQHQQHPPHHGEQGCITLS